MIIKGLILTVIVTPVAVYWMSLFTKPQMSKEVEIGLLTNYMETYNVCKTDDCKKFIVANIEDLFLNNMKHYE